MPDVTITPISETVYEVHIEVVDPDLAEYAQEAAESAADAAASAIESGNAAIEAINDQKGEPGGIPSLDGTGKTVKTQLPDDLLYEERIDASGGVAGNNTSILSVSTVDNFTSLERRGRSRFYVDDINRGGSFSFVPTSEGLTPNGGTIFAVEGGYAVRNYNGPVDVKWFGAVGDGATDDTAKIQAALNFFDEVLLDKGNTFNSSTLTISGNKKLYGEGTIKCTSAVNLFNLNGDYSYTLEGFNVDMNNTGGRFFIKDSTGCEALNLIDLEIYNISAPIFTLNGGGLINENVKISGCKFTCTNNISLGTFYSIRNYTLFNNLFKNCSCPAYTNQSGLPPLTNPTTGKIFISGNVFEGLSIADTNLSIILIRTNTSLFLSDVVIVNNIICGGKLGININEDSSGEMDRLVVSGNSIRNFVNAGIKISNPGVTTRNVVVSGNSISNDPDQIVNTANSQRGINLRSDSYVIQGNSISNCGNGGIVVEGDGVISGNNIFKCATRTDTSTTEEGGIYVVFGSVNIVGNKINDIGYAGALWASGISLNNSPLINKCIISNNIINDTQDTKTMAYCIRLSRFAGTPHPDNILISGNYLGDQATSGSKIYFRSNTQNTQKIFGNRGWGELITSVNPGVIADGATYSTNFTVPGAFTVDTVRVKFDGFRLQTGLTNRFKWLISANVTADNTVTVNITNLTGVSQTFNTIHALRLIVERDNISA